MMLVPQKKLPLSSHGVFAKQAWSGGHSELVPDGHALEHSVDAFSNEEPQ